jgi:hypothetical protein
MSITALLLGLGMHLRQPAPPDVWRVDGMPAERHPCLLFSAAELPAIQARIEQPPYSTWWAGIRGSQDMVSQALTWRLTGDEAKAQAVRERLLRCNPTGYHCSCGVADALQGVAEAYDLLYDYPGLSETDHRVIRAKIANACERLYLSALESGAGQHPGNQRTRGICALGSAAMVLAGYEDAAHTPREWLQRALDGIHEDRNLEFWRDDGMFIEGPTYSAFTLSVMLPFARYYDNFTGRWLFDDPRLRNALQYLIYVTQPDGNCNAMGTTNMMNVVNSLRLCLGAGDAADQAAYRWVLEEWGSISGGVREFCLFDEAVKPSIASLPTTRIFPVSQEISWRSEWSRNALALWVKGKDPWIAATHPVYSHADPGSFVLHAYGELLAVDAGYDHWVSYDLYPANLHNTLLVDGEGPGQDTPAVLENIIDADYLRSADVVMEYAGIKLRRTFLLIEDQFVAIVDDIESAADHDYTWQIQTPVSRATGEVTVDGNQATWTGFDPRTDNAGQVELDAYFAGDVAVEAVEGARWQPFGADPKTDSFDNWSVVARQRGTSVRFLTVLYPHPTGSPKPHIIRPEDPAEVSLFVGGSPEGGTLIEALKPGQPSRVPEASGRVVVRRWVSPLHWAYVAGPGRVVERGDTVVRIDGPGAAASPVPDGSGPPPAVYVAGPAGMMVRGSVGPDEPDAAADYRLLWKDSGLDASAEIDAQGWRFEVPADRPGPSAVISLHRSTEFEPPPPPATVTAVRVDGTEVPVRELVDLGRLAQPPRKVEVQFAGPRGELVAADYTTREDGRRRWDPLGSFREGRLSLELGELAEPVDHEVTVLLRHGAPLPASSLFNLRFSLRPLLANGGFEEAGGWSFGTWSDDARTQYETKAVAENPHSGNRCLMMRGVAGGLNMVASQLVPLKLGSTYVLSGFYRGDVPAKASLCNTPGTGQYIWSPAIGPSAEWTPFEWPFTVENPDTPLILALRLGSVGAVYFDDLELREQPPGG